MTTSYLIALGIAALCAWGIAYDTEKDSYRLLVLVILSCLLWVVIS